MDKDNWMEDRMPNSDTTHAAWCQEQSSTGQLPTQPFSHNCLPCSEQPHTHAYPHTPTEGRRKKCHPIGKVRASQGNKPGKQHSRAILPQARAWPEGRPRTCLRCWARGASPIPSSTFSSLSEQAVVGGVKPNMSFQRPKFLETSR